MLETLSIEESFSRAIKAHQAGDFYDAEDYYKDVVEKDPMHVDAWNNLGVVSLQLSQNEDAEKYLRKALAFKPDDPGALKNLAVCLSRKVFHLESANNFEGALKHGRELLGLPSNHDLDRAMIRRVLSASNQSAELTDFIDTKGEQLTVGRVLFVASMPRSGGTYMREALSRATNFPTRIASVGKTSNEDEIEMALWRTVVRDNCVLQHQIKGSHVTQEILRVFAVKPLVLTRNLADVVVSQVDAIIASTNRQWRFPGENSANNRTQITDWVIDNVVPWCCQYYAGWYAASQKIDVKFIDYADIVRDRAATIQQALTFWGIDSNLYLLIAMVALLEVEKDKTGYNRAEVGRGGRELSPAQLDRIVSHTSYYRTCDFTPLLETPKPIDEMTA